MDEIMVTLLAFELHKSIEEIEAMPLAHVARLWDIWEHRNLIDQWKMNRK